MTAIVKNLRPLTLKRLTMPDLYANILIAGGRDFQSYPLLESVCDHLLKRLEKEKASIQINSGLARGVDTLGCQYAKNRGYSILEFPANWNLFGKSAGYLRNKEMAEVATHAIIFWDGLSKGTRNMIQILKQKPEVPMRIIKY